MKHSLNAWIAVALLAALQMLGGCASVGVPAGPNGAVQPVVQGSEAKPVSASASASAAAPGSAAPGRAASASVAARAASAASEPDTPVAATPIDPLRPEVPVDLDSKVATIDLWVRIRRGFAMPNIDTPLVHTAEQWYAQRPDYVARMTERGSRYLFHIVEEVEKRRMPTELALLPFIESAFNPQAISSAKASGMWQFMPMTGKTFDLRQNVFRDDRRNVLASTRAALDYLQKLYDMFGDWHLALAAYNWGEGNVQRAINKNLRAGKPTDYLSLKMPNETGYYVPKLQAVKNLVASPAMFSLTLPPLENHPYFLSVPIERDIDVSLAVQLAEVSHDEFLTLNPQFDKPVILGAGTPQLLLPYANANRFVRNAGEHKSAFATWTAWVAPRMMKTSDVAKQVGMSEAQLREVNKIPLRVLVKGGSTLLIPRSAHLTKDISPHLAENASMSFTPEPVPPRRVTHIAVRGDTVTSVAKRYRVSPTQVAQWNKVSSTAQFTPGTHVLVLVPQATPRKAKSSSSKTKKSASGKRKSKN